MTGSLYDPIAEYLQPVFDWTWRYAGAQISPVRFVERVLRADALATARKAGSLVEQGGSWPIPAYSRTGCPRPGRHSREAIELCSRTGYDVVLLDCFDSYAWLCAATARWADAITMWAACTCAPRYRSWPVPLQ